MSEVMDVLKDGLSKQEEKLESELGRLEAKMQEQVDLNGETLKETSEQYKNIEETLLSLKERQDAFEKKAGRMGGGAEQRESFNQAITKALEENREELGALKTDGRPFSMSTKAVITEADAYTNDVVPADYVPGFKFDPERRIRVRQFLPQGTTNSDKIRFIQESNYTDGTATGVAENVASGQSDFDLTATDANVEKISAHFRVSKESLDDTAGLASHISLRGSQKYMNAEDAWILYDATYGLTITADDYSLDLYTGDSNAQEYDVLLEAIKQNRNDNYMPSAVMMSISKYFDMVRAKDADGRYIFPQEVIFGNQTPRIMGVPIIATNAINSNDGNDDDFLVADFPQLTTLFDRQGMQVRFYEQDQDNVVKDLVTVQISGRLALPTYLPNAGKYGRFSTAITNAGNS